VIDNWCEPRDDWKVPDASSGCWEARYDNDTERGKRTTRSLWGWSESVLRRLHEKEMLELCGDFFGFVATPDPTVHGGGLHVTAPGGALACHLDYDRHPNPMGTDVLANKRRAVNLIAFCHTFWGRSWGGEFYLADPSGKPIVEISPEPGRLVAFETNDLSYHGVKRVNTGQAERISVAAYLLADATPANTRTRALFMPNRGKR
jgi:2-oxoglutarate-Fe(II)-dependent oxygenase superfamily protein